MFKFIKIILSVILIQFIVASTSHSEEKDVKDCFEKVNRATFAFNMALDKVLFRPVAIGYRKLPSPIRTGTSNVLNNLGFEKLEKEDFGQTFGTMGIGEGCYLVLPVIGPSTVRDAVGSLISMTGGDAWYNVTIRNDTQYFNESDYYFSKLGEGVDFRAKNLESFDSLEKNSIDFYATVRSLYLQDRKRKISNLKVKTDTMDDSDWDDLDN